MATPVERLERLERLVGQLIEAITRREQVFRNISYYDYDEPASMAVTIARDTLYEFKEKPVECLYLFAAGCPIRVGLDKATSGESFMVPSGAFLPVYKLTKRVYARAIIGFGTLYIWGFYSK